MCTFVVEDSPADAYLTLEFLESAGLDYLHFCTGNKLLEFVSARQHNPHYKKPSVILLDINLPGLSGLEILEALRADEEFRQVPIAILTTSKYEIDRKRAFDLGADDFLTKPVFMDEWELLMEKIKDLVKRNKTLQ